MRLRKKGTQPMCGLIGKHIRIAKSRNQGLVGMEGKVIDESRNTVLIDGDKRRRLLKSAIVFELIEKKMQVEGSRIMRRPEDR